MRLHHAGRQTRTDLRYRNRAAQARGVSRVLVQRTIAGQGTVIVAGRRHPVPAGHALVIAIPGPAEWAYEGDGTPWRFAFASVACEPLPELAARPVIDLAAQPALDRIFHALVARRIDGDPDPQAALAYQLLLGVVALAGGTTEGGPERRLAERIAHAGGRVSIADLARRLGLSHGALTRRFTARFGEPPRAWAERLRLRSACTALAHGRPAAEAAEAAGYDDAAHFGRAFRRRLGLTPGTWSALSEVLRPWP